MQALSNLVINAREAYGENPGTIRLTLDTEEFGEEAGDIIVGARPGQYVRIKVIDQGSGMTPDMLSKACEPLFTTKHSSGQTGLGLSVVFSIVRAHDGFLTIESLPERGTTVTIYLPLVDMDTEITRGSAIAPRRKVIPTTSIVRMDGCL